MEQPENGETASAQLERHGTLDVGAQVAIALDRITQVLQNQNNFSGNQRIDEEDLFLERFQKFHPPKFDGDLNPEKAEAWLEEIVNIFTALRYTEERKVAFAKFQLIGAAASWWSIIETKWEQQHTPKTWENFLNEFNNKYFTAGVREARIEEFVRLQQGTHMVSEYVARFDKLAKFVPGLVTTDGDRKARFIQGLSIELKEGLASAEQPSYVSAVENAQRLERVKIERRQMQGQMAGASGWLKPRGRIDMHQRNTGIQPRPGPSIARITNGYNGPQPSLRWQGGNCSYCNRPGHREHTCWRKNGKCIGCGSEQHVISDCPRFQMEARSPQSTQRFVPQMGRGVTTKPKVHARVHAMESTEVVEGTIPIIDYLTRTTIDLGPTEPFTTLILSLGFYPSHLNYIPTTSYFRWLI